ncbi:DUF3429 domain-containing protein [Arenimonas alkanexedens]
MTPSKASPPPLDRAALVLGWAGVVPFLLLAGLVFVPAFRLPALDAFMAYSAVILSFLGGVRWGRALAAGAGLGQYVRAVLPGLWAWAAWLLLGPAPALTALAAGFVLVGAWDARGDALPAPASFRRLRLGLGLAVVGCHALALAAWLTGPA